MNHSEYRYPPIADYALISDTHCTALISRSGSVDWCCMPRVDSDSSFARLLDWEKGGYCAITPTEDGYASMRRYLPGTMVLETTFRTSSGEARLYDLFVMDAAAPENARYDLLRIVEGVAGEVELRMEVCARFDYGEIVPHFRRIPSGAYSAIGSNQALIIQADVPLEVVAHRDLTSTFTVRGGERVRLAMHYEHPELVERSLERDLPGSAVLDDYLERTCAWWRDWTSRMRSPYDRDEQTVRSAIILKSLTFEPTGAIIAAPTTSLPEWIGAARNWDYRFSWIRDSVFTVRVLHELGYHREADRFHKFIERSSAGSADQLQIMYGVDGKRRLTEIELDWLEGYRGSRPVRIGNAAAKQTQFDIYGELLEMAWEWHADDHETQEEYWGFLTSVVDTVCGRWREPDRGIWEVRGEPSHHVYSKVMCWAAINCGIKLAQDNGFEAPLERWIDVRQEIRAAIETDGYDERRGVFVQAFGSKALDAATLLLPRVGFIEYDDPRMLRTVDALCDDLERGGLLLRYSASDGLQGPEGVFLPCTFWLVYCMAYQGQQERAWKYYRRALECANDVGLFSEEFDVDNNEMLGNFPQGLTHVSQVMAYLALTRAENSSSGEDG